MSSMKFTKRTIHALTFTCSHFKEKPILTFRYLLLNHPYRVQLIRSKKSPVAFQENWTGFRG
jgi:hypothetical protein